MEVSDDQNFDWQALRMKISLSWITLWLSPPQATLKKYQSYANHSILTMAQVIVFVIQSLGYSLFFTFTSFPLSLVLIKIRALKLRPFGFPTSLIIPNDRNIIAADLLFQIFVRSVLLLLNTYILANKCAWFCIQLLWRILSVSVKCLLYAVLFHPFCLCFFFWTVLLGLIIFLLICETNYVFAVEYETNTSLEL